ncbi:MAG: pitrilysin family protein [Phycisphaerales bacterium]
MKAARCLTGLILMAWCALGAGPAVQAPPAGLEKPETVVEDVRAYTLGNGMRVLLNPDPAASKVAVLMVYFVGSRHEGLGERGMAHLLEHLLFKGSSGFPEPAQELKAHGAFSNASTWSDRTIYFEEMLSSPENIDFALRFEADRMQNAFISDGALASEMTVVRNEFEMKANDPLETVLQNLLAAGYTWHPYGAATIGNRSDIERVPAVNLRRFYKHHYRPSNAMLVISGKFDDGAVLKQIDALFSPLANPAEPRATTWTEEPVQEGARSVEIRRDVPQASVGVMYHVPARSHEDASALSLLNPLLSDVPWGRLQKGLVGAGLAGQVNILPFAMEERGQLLVIITLKEGQEPEAALRRLTEIMEGFAREPVTAEEAQRARASWLSQSKSTRKNNLSFAFGLADAASAGDWRLWFIERDRVKAMSAEQMQAVYTRYFLPSNRTSAVLIPTKDALKAVIPPRPQLADAFSSYHGTEQVRKGEAFDASPKAIEARTVRRELAPGVRLAVVPKRTAEGAVRAVIAIRAGDEAALAGQEPIGLLAAGMLSRGTASMSFQQRSDELDRMQSTILPSYQGGVLSLTISTDRTNFARCMEIAGDMLKNAAFPASEFGALKADQAAFAGSQVDQPLALAVNALQRATAPFDAASMFHVMTLAERSERVASAALESVRDFYRRVFGPSNVQVAVVGDVEAASAETAIHKLLDGWQGGMAFVRPVREFRPVRAEETAIRTPDKPMAAVGLASALPLKDTDPDAEAMLMAVNVLGRGLHSRIGTRLRGKDGLSYDSLASLSMGKLDAASSLIIYATCARENADKTATALREEVDRWSKGDITQDELATARNGYRMSVLGNLSADETLADLLARDMYLDRSFLWYDQLLVKLDGLNAAEVNAAVRKRFSDATFADVRAGDFPAGKRSSP